MDSVILILCCVAISIIFMKYLTDIWNEIVTWCHNGVEPEPQIESIKYGALYNWYAATDARNIAASGWHVPTKTELDALITYLGGAAIAGGKLKETGLIYWNAPNTGATNEVGFNARSGGWRSQIGGTFISGSTEGNLWTATPIDASWTHTLTIVYNSGAVNFTSHGHIKMGHSIRLLKDTTTLTHGQSGTYTGNDGKVYRTICIGTQEWVADNLAETKYRDGSDIPLVTDNSAWAALTTGGMCYYDNDINNA